MAAAPLNVAAPPVIVHEGQIAAVAKAAFAEELGSGPLQGLSIVNAVRNARTSLTTVRATARSHDTVRVTVEIAKIVKAAEAIAALRPATLPAAAPSGAAAPPAAGARVMLALTDAVIPGVGHLPLPAAAAIPRLPPQPDDNPLPLALPTGASIVSGHSLSRCSWRFLYACIVYSLAARGSCRAAPCSCCSLRRWSGSQSESFGLLAT